MGLDGLRFEPQMLRRLNSFVRRAADMYVDGFRSMTVGRKLWIIIAIKLVVFFLVLKICFFPDLLATKYSSDSERADAVRRSLSLP